MVSNKYQTIIIIIMLMQVKIIMPYHQLMSPTWLQRYSNITGNFTLHSQYLELGHTTVLGQRNFYQQALQVRLVAPGILKKNDCVGITITVAIDTVLGESTDHDPTFGVSDGTSFIGFTIPDVFDYGHRL